MNDIEKIWREKSDEDLLEAAARLDDYTEEGQVVIREEMKRRGMEDPVEQAGDVVAEPATNEEGEVEEMALPEPRCIRCEAKMRFRGTRTLLGEVGNLFANAEAFDLYVCPRCGHAELFVNEIGVETDGE